MRLRVFLVLAGLFAVPARAEVPDCATFPGGAKFACYDNVSRAPKSASELAKPGAKARPATSSRKAGREN